jgi:hypothetical protein
VDKQPPPLEDLTAEAVVKAQEKAVVAEQMFASAEPHTTIVLLLRVEEEVQDTGTQCTLLEVPEAGLLEEMVIAFLQIRVVLAVRKVLVAQVELVLVLM